MVLGSTPFGIGAGLTGAGGAALVGTVGPDGGDAATGPAPLPPGFGVGAFFGETIACGVEAPGLGVVALLDGGGAAADGVVAGVLFLAAAAAAACTSFCFASHATYAS